MQGLVLKVSMFTSARASFPRCLLKKHLALTLAKRLGVFPPNGLRSAVFSKGHGLVKADLAQSLAVAKSSPRVFIPEVGKPSSHLSP